MINPEILKKYKPADESFLVNCGHPYKKEYDPSLIPIRISLPKPPPLHLIDGFGLPAEDQVWNRPVMPEKLVQLEKKIKRELELRLKDDRNQRVTGYKILDGIWEEIKNDLDYYNDELIWIKKQWWYRINGYWFYNYGKPTYICGWHYFYLAWWKIEGRIYPEYRDVDRKKFLFRYYLYITHEAFKNYDDDGFAIPNDDGIYEIVDMPVKTFYGTGEPKNRRGGTTNQAQCIQLEVTSKSIGDIAVIFSMTKTSAESLFKDKTVKSWTNIPFFFLPTWEGYFDQKTEINFKKPKHIVVGDDLNSRIAFAESAMGAEYDGQRVTFAIFDESGKTKECDVTERWDMHKQGMGVGDGADICGFSIHPSTVEEMDSGGGVHYQNLIKASNFYKRNTVTGQTESGLCVIFFSAYEGLEKFIGKYGESIIDDPTLEQIKNGFKFNHGAKKHLQSNRDQLLKSKDPRSQIKYRRLVVKYPFILEECFQLTIGNSSINLDIINKRCAELSNLNPPRTGNLEWVNGVRFGKVYFEDTPDGRFEFSKLPKIEESNLIIISYREDPIDGTIKEVYGPQYGYKHTIGVDPYHYKGNKQLAINTGSYQSDGGISAYWERDLRIDPLDKNIYDIESQIAVAVYRSRPLTKVFNEDILKLAWFIGGMVYPERNVGDVEQYFIENNCEGFLLYDINPITGKYEDKAGYFLDETKKEEMWRLFQNHIEYRGHKEKHVRLLKEIASLKTFDDLHRMDMASSFGGCLLGSQSRTRKVMESLESANCDFESMWKSL